jgi:hypothetical protein
MTKWPCSGLQNIHHITACFDGSDLIDIEIFNHEIERFETRVEADYNFLGTGAMPALLEDAVKYSIKIQHSSELIEPGYILTEKELKTKI